MILPRAWLLSLAIAAVLPPYAIACTGFCAAAKGRVLAGNNEDFVDPHTRVWFFPAAEGAHGRVYLGYEHGWPQGGMNDQGLFFDGFATVRVKIVPTGKPLLEPVCGRIPNDPFPGAVLDRFLSECATVADVVRLVAKHEIPWADRSVLMFADARGEAAIFDAGKIIRKTGRFLVQTNFRQAAAATGAAPCERFRIATSMLDAAGENISIGLFRRILAATHQESPSATVYSNICDLKRRRMYLYHFHNYENVVVIDLARELTRGERSIALASLFPRTHAAEQWAAAHRDALKNMISKR
jgi:hypothetical protein